MVGHRAVIGSEEQLVLGIHCNSMGISELGVVPLQDALGRVISFGALAKRNHRRRVRDGHIKLLVLIIDCQAVDGLGSDQPPNWLYIPFGSRAEDGKQVGNVVGNGVNLAALRIHIETTVV
jgi:hypothetical protein